MWKKEDVKSQGAAEPSSPAVTSPAGVTQGAASASSLALPVSPRAAACIGHGIRIKGEVTGTEDLFVDGQVEGKLNLTANSSLTIGPNGNVKADLMAREIIVRGKVEGRIIARDKLEVWSTGQINGEVQTDRLAIEDGALLRGKVEAGKQPAKASETKAAAAASGSSASSKDSNPGTAAD